MMRRSDEEREELKALVRCDDRLSAGHRRVGVLVRAALPRASWITEVDSQTGIEPQLQCWAISMPWSQVKDRRSCSGRVPIVSAIALRTAPAPAPVIGGPAFTLGLL